MLTYASFLVIFLFIPIILLVILNMISARKQDSLQEPFNTFNPYLMILALMIIAFVYTTPWDNYLVATGVWYYDPQLVLGITFGYVPLEEYTFFLVQTLMSGLIFVLLAKYLPPPQKKFQPNSHIRYGGIVVGGIIWIVSAILFLLQWAPGTYLSLILIWALPPILLQIWYGGDVLVHHFKLVLAAIAIPFIYLTIADYIAILDGVWTISPAQTTGLLLGNVLAIEEAIFFLITNVLVVLGLTLTLEKNSHERARKYLQRTQSYFQKPPRNTGASSANSVK